MKFIDKMESEMDIIYQQTVEAKKTECANALTEVKYRCKDFGFKAQLLKDWVEEQ